MHSAVNVGIRYPRGQKLTLDEKNAMRQESDLNQRTKILEILNAHQVVFSETDLLVLGQPQTEEPDLYWKSIQDFLNFTAVVFLVARSRNG
jgi:hypothetical protein